MVCVGVCVEGETAGLSLLTGEQYVSSLTETGYPLHGHAPLVSGFSLYSAFGKYSDPLTFYTVIFVTLQPYSEMVSIAFPPNQSTQSSPHSDKEKNVF